MTHRASPAEIALRRLGITDPKEIDVDAIAWDMGAKVRYRPLESCEARIVGNATNAVITVNSKSHPRRQRFSVAHELGHWTHHRNQLLMCQAEQVGVAGHVLNPERVADLFARDLLMPEYLFHPVARAYSQASFRAVRDIAETFDTSLTATAIRLVEGKYFTAALICHNRQGRKWFTRSPEVPERWFPAAELSADSFAFDTLFGSKEPDAFPRKIGADAWFDRYGADQYEVHEQTIRVAEDEILTLVLITDEEMLKA